MKVRHLVNKNKNIFQNKFSKKEIYIVDENFPKPTWEYNMNGFPGGERYLIIYQILFNFQQNSSQFFRFLGKGLVTEINHDKWKFRRALFNAGFHRQ